MRNPMALVAVLAMVLTTLATAPVAAQSDGELTPRSAPERVSGSVSADVVSDPDEIVDVFIQLDEPSVAEFRAATGANPAEQRAQGRRVLAQQDALRALLDDLIVEEHSSLAVGANGLRVSVRSGDIPAIGALEGVETVGPVAKHRPLHETSIPAIGADQAQAAGWTGDGTVIAVIDTGIDYTHAALGGSGNVSDYDDNDPGVLGEGLFPTAKVIGGRDFAGPVYDAGSDDPSVATPQPDPDPIDVNGHGTHVAGSAAGADISGDVEEGVAPDAELLAVKVFGDVAGSTELTSDGIEFSLDPDNDLDMEDAADVINMSLGSDFGHPDDPSAIASQNAVDNGVVVVVASGNAGPVPYVTGSPSVAPGAISVAASIDSGVTVLGVEVNSPPSIAGQYEAQPGDFGPLDPPTTADLAIAETPETPMDNGLREACEPIDNDLTGLIAIVSRGTCSFSLKILNAQNAGAVGALVVNNVEGPPIGMAHDPTFEQATIPAVMVSLTDGTLIAQTAQSETVNMTLSDDVQIPKPELADTMAGFTSRGPGQGSTFKPEVSAPGFSIHSADVGTGTGGTLNSGTSMATPHVAGVAAQLIEKYPALDPSAIKSLILNSARGALTDPAGGVVPLASQGTGVVQADRAALDVGGYTTPAAISFGRYESTEVETDTRTIDVTRLDGAGEATYDVEIVPNQEVTGVTWSLSSGTVTTTSGDASVDVSVEVDPTIMTPDDGAFSQREADGWVKLTNTADEADTMVVGLMAVVDPASTVDAVGGEGVLTLDNGGPSAGLADGYTLIGDQGSGSFAGLGFRTQTVDPDGGEPFTYIEFGLALSRPWASLSSSEVDVFIDTDQDGADDYALVAADLGFLTGSPDPAGQVATALFDLETGTGALLYFAVADNNDQVAILPADATGDFGFLDEGDTEFDVTAVFFDQIGVAGVSETFSVDLSDQITDTGGLSAVVEAGGSTEVEVSGEGEMLWLYQNNPVPTQFSITEVTQAEPPAEPPDQPPDEPPGDVMFEDVPAGHLFHDEIVWLAQQGITRGCNPPDNDRYCPDDPVSRGQMSAFLNRSLDLAATSEDFFVDDDESIFEGDIDRLAAADITRGCNPPVNDRYCPERDLTRAEMATFMVRGFDFTAGEGSDRFVDDDDNIHEGAIDILGTVGVTRGCNPPDNDRYCPDRLITRGEMAAFIFRAHQAAGLGD